MITGWEEKDLVSLQVVLGVVKETLKWFRTVYYLFHKYIPGSFNENHFTESKFLQ